MSGKSYLLVILPFFPPIALAAALTRGFQKNRLPVWAFVLFILTLLLLLLLVWKWTVEKPARDFFSAINRAIHGDYQARFSCSDKNPVFLHLSHAFNSFMSCVESQTNELIKNRRLQSQLYENEKIYRSALELTCERVFEADLTHNRLIYGHDVYQRTFPFLKTEMFDDMIQSISQNAVAEEDADLFSLTFSRRNLMEMFRETGKAEVDLEYRQKRSDSPPFWVSSTIILLHNSRSESLKIIGYVKNIDARKRKELEILRLSQKDSLTGLYNKKVTQSLIETYLNEEGRCGNHAVIMMDIDNFKRVNDTLGHDQGDAALVSVSQKLQSVFRSTDIVGRVGGDEFLLLIKNFNSEELLLSKLKQLCELFRDVHLKDKDYRVSGSIGVSIYPKDGSAYNELFKKADIALYYSKAHGKNQFYLYGGNYDTNGGTAFQPQTV